MIQRPIEAPPIHGEPEIQQAANEVNTSFSCMGRCRDISFAVSGIFLAYQAIDYYTKGQTYSAVLSTVSFGLVGSSYYIVRKYGDIHAITKALQLALVKLEATTRDALAASTSLHNTAQAIEPIAGDVLRGISNLQQSVQALGEESKQR